MSSGVMSKGRDMAALLAQPVTFEQATIGSCQLHAATPSQTGDDPIGKGHVTSSKRRDQLATANWSQ
jgi:hypothetical protein